MKRSRGTHITLKGILTNQQTRLLPPNNINVIAGKMSTEICRVLHLSSQPENCYIIPANQNKQNSSVCSWPYVSLKISDHHLHHVMNAEIYSKLTSSISKYNQWSHWSHGHNQWDQRATYCCYSKLTSSAPEGGCICTQIIICSTIR